MAMSMATPRAARTLRSLWTRYPTPCTSAARQGAQHTQRTLGSSSKFALAGAQPSTGLLTSVPAACKPVPSNLPASSAPHCGASLTARPQHLAVRHRTSGSNSPPAASSSTASSAADGPASPASNSASSTASFGFRTVDAAEKQGLVGQVFTSVASQYDLMNDLMSAGTHRLWKDHFINTLAPTKHTHLLDVAGGTGDIAFRFLRKAGAGAKVVVCDINAAMLEQGRQRSEAQELEGASWVCGDAENLPFPDNTFDAYTIAFGIRNVTNIDKALREARRVIKPGGRFLCLEFSHLTNPMLQHLYDLYSFEVIPAVGEVVTRDRESYQYLVESIRQFPRQEEFSRMIRDAGFGLVTHENLNFGVVAIHSGFKLSSD